MNQETAKRLLVEGATLVMLDVPQGTEFGIDMKSWSTGEKFRGVKMIPPGVHFIHYSAIDEYGQIAPKVGFFYNFKKSEFVLKKWDSEEQDFYKNTMNESEIVQLKDNITVLDKFLGPYPYDILSRWLLLTSQITENLLQKLLPESGQVRSALDLMSYTDAQRPRKDKSDANNSLAETSSRAGAWEDKTDSLLPDLKPLPGTELRLTSFPKHNYPPGSTPTEITKHSLDLTYVLETIINQHSKPTDVIGELQFSYICFLVGHSLEAFEHWKNMVNLLCSCDAAIIRTLKSSNADGRLKTKSERFKEGLTKAYEWDFSHLDSDDEDEAPVIVET